MSTHVHRGVARQVVKDAFNGEYESVDPAVRRSVVSLASHMDTHSDAVAEEIRDLCTTVKDMKRLLFAATSSFVLILVAATINLIVQL